MTQLVEKKYNTIRRIPLNVSRNVFCDEFEGTSSQDHSNAIRDKNMISGLIICFKYFYFSFIFYFTHFFIHLNAYFKIYFLNIKIIFLTQLILVLFLLKQESNLLSFDKF
jgi:hypothetical protein